jgi:hypothetical protein
MAPTGDLSFEQQVLAAFQVLRGALIEVFAAANVDTSRPYPAARQLQINKNLTWKASKIIRATGPSEAIHHLPGKGGMRLLLEALESHGASATAIENTRRAVDAFDRVIEKHTGDKATLELMLDGLNDGTGDAEQLEKSRKLAYQGNSGVWGMQVRARLTTFVMAPDGPGSDIFDSILLTGFLGLKRLRSETPWTILRLRSYQDDGSAKPPANQVSLDPKAEELWGVPLLPAYSTPGLPRLNVRHEEHQLAVELPGGPVGMQGSADIFFGRVDRSFASMLATPTDKRGEYLTDYTLPIREAQFDVLIHEDLPPVPGARFQLFSRLDGQLPPPSKRRDRMALPIHVEVRDLGFGLPAMATPLYPRYTEMIGETFRTLGWDPSRFRTLRAHIEYPPLGTVGVFSFPLEER